MYYLRAHIRIVSAFIMREVATRYGRSPGGYIWAFLEPVAFIFMMSALMGTFGRMPPKGESFMLFYATGYLAYNFFKGMEGYLTSSISSNKALFEYPVVAPIDAVVARFILQAITSVIVAFIIISVAINLMWRPIQVSWPEILQAILLAWALAAGVALTNIALFFRFPLYQKVYGIATRPLFLLSGVFYIPSSMPHPIGDILLMNPVTHVVLRFREGFYGEAGVDGFDFAFLAECSLGAFFVGMVAFTFFPSARRRAQI